MKRIAKFICTAAVLGLASAGLQGKVQAAEFGANTPYYEDDGWADITEWFDGNDYNPTDEAWWRWDDETYNAAEDTSGDEDSDNWFGYTRRDDNDWYYDYYDPYVYGYYDYDDNGMYEYSSQYYDFDKDGAYDAYASYWDSDGDGTYEDVDYYSFNTSAGNKAQNQPSKQNVARSSKQQTVTGQIEKTKLVKVRGGQNHVVVAIKPQQGQSSQPIIADLGSADSLKNVNPKLGDKVTIKGAQAQVGKQNVVIAKSIDLNGKQIQVNRSARNMTGQVVDTRKTKVRGQEHLIAMVQTSKQGKAQKIAVDLGPSDRLNMNINKGSTITFSGFPVKVKDRSLMLAQSVQSGGQVVQINRQGSAVGGAGSAGGTQQGGSSSQPATSNSSTNQNN